MWWAKPAMPEPPGALYAGTVLLGLSQVIVYGNMEVVFSKQITQHIHEVGDSGQAAIFSIYGIINSFARFLGPLITGFVLPIGDTATGGGAPCLTKAGAFNPQSTCCFTPSAFIVTTCEVVNINVYVPILIAISCVAVALGWWYLAVVVDYGDDVQDLATASYAERQRREAEAAAAAAAAAATSVKLEDGHGDKDNGNGNGKQPAEVILA